MKPIARFSVIVMSIIFGISLSILMIAISVVLPLLSVFEYVFRGTWTWLITRAETLLFDIMPDRFKEFTNKFMNMFDKKQRKTAMTDIVMKPDKNRLHKETGRRFMVST